MAIKNRKIRARERNQLTSDMIHEYLSGKSMIDIAKDRRVSRQYAHSLMKKHPRWKEILDFNKATKAKRHKETLTHIHELRGQGLTVRETSERLGITVNQFYTFTRTSG